MPQYPISKSALQLGAQCPRALWIKQNYRNAGNTGDEDSKEEAFRIGNIVGGAAQWYFFDDEVASGRGRSEVIPTGSLGWDESAYAQYAQMTRDLMADPDVVCIAEAAFFTGDLIVFVDLLHRTGPDTWDIYEVKATGAGRIGGVHARDAAWQTYVARDLCGANIGNTYLMHPYEGWSIIEELTMELDDVDAQLRETPGDLALLDERDRLLYRMQDCFEVVDMFSPWIYNYSTGQNPLNDRGPLSDMYVDEAIAYLSEMTDEPLPPSIDDPSSIIYDDVKGNPGNAEMCHSPYGCAFSQKCVELWQGEGI